jgi:hypothetical protein
MPGIRAFRHKAERDRTKEAAAMATDDDGVGYCCVLLREVLGASVGQDLCVRHLCSPLWRLDRQVTGEFLNILQVDDLAITLDECKAESRGYRGR